MMPEYQKYETRNGVQRVRFLAKKLAHSSSEVPGKPRWIEFTLYLTKSGKYILYRVGKSHVYHHIDCPAVVKNHLGAHPEESPPSGGVPCPDCNPMVVEMEGIFPEVERHSTQAANSPEGVMALLYQKDPSGVQYLTNVARDLIIEAARTDIKLAEAFYDYNID